MLQVLSRKPITFPLIQVLYKLVGLVGNKYILKQYFSLIQKDAAFYGGQALIKSIQ